MAENYVPNLGSIPSENARRDAVHVAVAPVIAGMTLHPGEHVGPGTHSGQFYSGISFPCIGIVDPFRNESVIEGERFWLFLYPGTVTSLRHVWTHQAFKTTLSKEITNG